MTAALAALGGPGAPLYVGFSLLVALAGGLLYAGGHRRTAAGFGLVAASALVLGAGRFAVRGSVDRLSALLVVLVGGAARLPVPPGRACPVNPGELEDRAGDVRTPSPRPHGRSQEFPS